MSRVGKTYVALEEDIHISSFVRLPFDSLIKPLTVTICQRKLKDRPDVPVNKLYSVKSVDRGYISTHPRVMITNVVVHVKEKRALPLMNVNNTTKCIKLRKGCVVTVVDKVENTNMINSVKRFTNKQKDSA